uniref:Uncharacterized protein n=1 Tax=Acrobeloides nanus TaxID=290746 RepID=A0A914ELF1_9BILA
MVNKPIIIPLMKKQGKRFIEKFLAADDSKSMPIYTHFTNATDTDNIELVFGSCMAAVLNYTMGNAALT